MSSGIKIGMSVRVKGLGGLMLTYTGSSYKDGEIIVRHKNGRMWSVKIESLKAISK